MSHYSSITSPTNETIKFLKKLQLKKHRDQTGQFMVENAVIIHDAIQAGFIPEQLFITEELQATADEAIAYILKNTNDLTLITERVNKAFSTLATPPGIAAVFTKSKTAAWCHSGRSAAETRNPENNNETNLYLNAIADPGNLGTILRTALAFNVTNIIVDEHCADVYNPKTIQAAKESIFKLNISEDKNLKLLKQIKEHMPIVATDMQGTSIHKSEILHHKLCCLVFGSESHGISPAIHALADEIVSIPTPGDIESLNVAISAGIILYTLTNRTV